MLETTQHFAGKSPAVSRKIALIHLNLLIQIRKYNLNRRTRHADIYIYPLVMNEAIHMLPAPLRRAGRRTAPFCPFVFSGERVQCLLRQGRRKYLQPS